jgi:hypothetical protein
MSEEWDAAIPAMSPQFNYEQVASIDLPVPVDMRFVPSRHERSSCASLAPNHAYNPIAVSNLFESNGIQIYSKATAFAFHAFHRQAAPAPLSPSDDAAASPLTLEVCSMPCATDKQICVIAPQLQCLTGEACCFLSEFTRRIVLCTPLRTL